MRYKIKYQTRGKVESYIAMATSLIAELGGELFEEYELCSILQNVADEVMRQAELSSKGLTARPECELNDGATKTLQVYNTNGREVLLVWFERIYDKGQGPQVRKL